jgi:Signal transduction histidine kinase regulating citrate/malate metabolism
MSGINQLIDYIMLALFWLIMMFFMTDSRLPKLPTTVFLILPNAILMLAAGMLVHSVGLDLAKPYLLVALLGVNILIGISLCKRRDFTAIFSVLAAASFALALRTLEGIIYDLLADYKITIVFIIICYGIVIYFTISWLRPSYIRLARHFHDIWEPLCLIPLSFIILFFLFAVYPSTVTGNPKIIPGMIVLVPVQIFIYYFIFKSYLRLDDEMEAKQDLQALNNRISLVQNQENLVLEAENRVRIYRHDFRHYSQLITACLNDGDIDQAKKIIDDLSNQIETTTRIEKYCTSITLNAVISHYMQRCRSNGIDMKVDMHVAEELPVNDMSLAVVISNALENSFNACMRIEDERIPFISLTCTQSKTQLFLEVKNNYEGTVYFDDNGRLPISMNDEHGIGTRSISQFAKNNRALLDYDTSNGIFTLHLLVYIN